MRAHDGKNVGPALVDSDVHLDLRGNLRPRGPAFGVSVENKARRERALAHPGRRDEKAAIGANRNVPLAPDDQPRL